MSQKNGTHSHLFIASVYEDRNLNIRRLRHENEIQRSWVRSRQRRVLRWLFVSLSQHNHCSLTAEWPSVRPNVLCSIQSILWDSPVTVLILSVFHLSPQTHYPISAYRRYTVQCHFSFNMAQQPTVGQGLLRIEDSRSHSDTLQSVGLLWTSDQLVAETSTRQYTTLSTDRHPCPPVGFELTISAGETHALDGVATRTGSTTLL